MAYWPPIIGYSPMEPDMEDVPDMEDEDTNKYQYVDGRI